MTVVKSKWTGLDAPVKVSYGKSLAPKEVRLKKAEANFARRMKSK